MGLNLKQEELIAALLSAKTKELAAERVGISTTTMYAWLKKPEFMEAYRAARRVVFEEAIAILQRGARRAANVLMKKLKSKKDADGIAAVKALFDISFKHKEIAELEARMDLIEGKAKGEPPADEANEPTEPTNLDMNDPCEIRRAWMRRMGYDDEVIAISIKVDRPQSVVEEQRLLDAVREPREAES